MAQAAPDLEVQIDKLAATATNLIDGLATQRDAAEAQRDDLIHHLGWVVGFASGQHADPEGDLAHIADQMRQVLDKIEEA